MTPHLTISYANQTPSGMSPAGAQPAGEAAAANPLGFLAALLDQFLAGADQPAPEPDAPPAAAPAVPVALPAAPPEAEPETDTLARILRVLLGTDDDAPETAPDANPDTDTDTPATQMLAAFGIEVPATPADPTPETLNTLSTQLRQLSTALADAAPRLAARLETVAAALTAPDADPAFVEKLTAAVADPDPLVLDALLRKITAPQPPALPATPQIAGTTRLDLPAALAPTPAPAEPAPVTRKTSAPAPAETPRDGTPKLRLVAQSADPAPDPAAPRADPLSPRGDAALPPQPNASTPAAARALPAAYQPATSPINMGQLAFEMVRQVHQGASRFTIRLDPPELGRVDVRLHVDASGAATARLTVDRAETLDLFQRDQRTLERALAQAGFDAARTSLEFSLRQDGSAGFAGDRQPEPASPTHFSLDGEAAPQAPSPAITLYRGTASAGGVNIFV